MELSQKKFHPKRIVTGQRQIQSINRTLLQISSYHKDRIVVPVLAHRLH